MIIHWISEVPESNKGHAECVNHVRCFVVTLSHDGGQIPSSGVQ